MEPLPKDPVIYLDNLASKIRAIDGLSCKVHQVALVNHFSGRNQVPVAEVKQIFQMLWHFNMLRNTCILKHARAVITPTTR